MQGDVEFAAAASFDNLMKESQKLTHVKLRIQGGILLDPRKRLHTSTWYWSRSSLVVVGRSWIRACIYVGS